MKYIISLILLLGYGSIIVAQDEVGDTEDERPIKEFVKSFSLRNVDTIRISLPIPYEIIDWDRDIVRTFTSVESFSLPENIIKTVSRSGRYRMKVRRKNHVASISLPTIKDKITVKGSLLSDEVVARIYVPEGFPLKVVCSTKTPMEQLEDLWIQQEVLTRRLNYPIKRAINADNYYDVNFQEGEILTAEKIIGTRRFLKLTVRVEDKTYEVVSRIGSFYDPVELIGQAVIFVAYTEKPEIRRLNNEGMVLVKMRDEHQIKLLEKRDLPDFFFMN